MPHRFLACCNRSAGRSEAKGMPFAGTMPVSQLDYGLIGNCQISALVDRSGKVVWCCMPRLDSSSIFASMLDPERGGYWSIEPAQGPLDAWETRQHYLRNTNVLLTQFIG